jgi:metal-responsive CopG/Arc/MetJ family transcriptional regulator
MKEKTSITLSRDVLKSVDRLAGSKHSRSAFIERVLRRYLRERAKAALEARDLERINNAADRLNLEVAEVLDYQASRE